MHLMQRNLSITDLQASLPRKDVGGITSGSSPRSEFMFDELRLRLASVKQRLAAASRGRATAVSACERLRLGWDGMS